MNEAIQMVFKTHIHLESRRIKEQRRTKAREDRAVRQKSNKIRILLGIAVAILVIVIGGCNVWYWNTEGGQRAIKSFKSSNGGLERTVEAYDQSGKLIKSYRGKIDIKDTEYGNKVLFDLNGKRITLYNATVVVEEQ